MSIPSFFNEVRSFVSEHKNLCILTLGLAVVGYAIGNLAGRVVIRLYDCFGTAEKTKSVAQDIFDQDTLDNDLTDIEAKTCFTSPLMKDEKIPIFAVDTSPSYSKKHTISSSQSDIRTPQVKNSTSDSPNVENTISTQLSPIAKKLLEAYNTPKEGWVMVPPKDQMHAEADFMIIVGAIGYPGMGRWKIHISIDPTQMEQAIPILIDVLMSENAPRLGFKVQTKINLEDVHQIGKELALIFDDNIEKATLTRESKSIQDCLSLLWKKLYEAGIRPEPGSVLTPDTMNTITNAPEGEQTIEKKNLTYGKFDRAIPCPHNINYYHYRDENIIPMLEVPPDLVGIPNLYAVANIMQLVHKNPKFAHNPSKAPDPFVDLIISQVK